MLSLGSIGMKPVMSDLSYKVGSIGMKPVMSDLSYKGTILQRHYRKITIKWSFSYNSFVKFHGKNIWGHSMTVLYPNPCYREVCYKGTAASCHLRKGISDVYFIYPVTPSI